MYRFELLGLEALIKDIFKKNQDLNKCHEFSGSNMSHRIESGNKGLLNINCRQQKNAIVTWLIEIQ